MIVSEFVQGRGLRGGQAAPPGRARPDRRDRLPLLLRLHVPPPPVLAATRTPATACCWTTAAWPSSTSGCSSASAPRWPSSSCRSSGSASRAAAEELIEHLHAAGFIGDPSHYTPEGIVEQFHDFTWWYTLDEEVQLEPEIATQVMIEMSDPRSTYFGKMRHETLPPDHLFGRRLEMLTLAVMSQLRAKGQLAPDRARVDLRRRAGDRARPRRGRLPRARMSAGWRLITLAAVLRPRS